MILVAERQEIDVPCRSQLFRIPYSKERRALQGEPIHVVRNGQAVEEALGSVSLKHDVEVEPAVAGEVQESLAHRRGEVVDLPGRGHAERTSSTGSTSDFARQTSAARQIWSAVALRSKRASRRASIATSLPTSR